MRKAVIDPVHQNIFKGGSRTYFYSTLFFPRPVKEDVFILYSFVRRADDFVDAIPQQKEAFFRFCDAYRSATKGLPAGDVVIDSFVDLARRKKFDSAWIEAFLWSMERDTLQSTYRTLDELSLYLYGSAEVVGLMMARLLELPEQSYAAARHLGRAMQYINFIRDIAEDNILGRTYLPQEDMDRHGLRGLRFRDASRNPRGFRAFIREQILRYRFWQRAGEEGYRFIPRRYLVPIRTAADMYAWTADTIARDPFIIYRKRVKPSTLRICSRGLQNMAMPHRRGLPADRSWRGSADGKMG